MPSAHPVSGATVPRTSAFTSLTTSKTQISPDHGSTRRGRRVLAARSVNQRPRPRGCASDPRDSPLRGQDAIRTVGGLRWKSPRGGGVNLKAPFSRSSSAQIRVSPRPDSESRHQSPAKKRFLSPLADFDESPNDDWGGRCIAHSRGNELSTMPTPTIDDHFEIVSSTAYWTAKQLPFRVPRAPLVRVGAPALAHAIDSHDPDTGVGLETWCRQEVRRAIRDFITDRYEA